MAVDSGGRVRVGEVGGDEVVVCWRGCSNVVAASDMCDACSPLPLCICAPLNRIQTSLKTSSSLETFDTDLHSRSRVEPS